jgi:hypothetical protein
VQVVQEEDIDAPVEGVRRRTNVRLDGLCRVHRNGGRDDRDVDERKRRRLLWSPVLEDFEIIRRQTVHERTCPVGDDRVDFDEVNLGPECDRGLLAAPRLLRSTDSRTHQERER